MSAEYLMECACWKIVCMKGPQNLSCAKVEYEGYCDACKGHDLKTWTVEGDYTFSGGLDVAEELLTKYSDVDGIVMCNDKVAIATYKVLHRNHIVVPNQI